MRGESVSRWAFHPRVRSEEELSFGERAADRMKAVFATWSALIGILLMMAVWMSTDGLGGDKPPWIGLNLVLSCIAALQCFILLIAAKRADQISSELARHDFETDQDAKAILEALRADFVAMMQTQAAQDVQLKQQTAALMALMAKYGPPPPPAAPVPATVPSGGGPGPVSAAVAVPEGDAR